MSNATAITAHHRERLALIYLRQSTPIQVREHRESTARQYAMADEAVRLGWPPAAVLTIDADLGHSGRPGTLRPGFAELVKRVCLGEVGAIFGLEISRFARSSADLQRLLEFCSLTDTLIIDADGVYDLRQLNDRLIVGLNRPDSYSTSCSTSFRRSVTRLRRLFDGTRVVPSQPTTHPWWRRERTTERIQPNDIPVSESSRNPPWVVACDACLAPPPRAGRHTPRSEA